MKEYNGENRMEFGPEFEEEELENEEDGEELQ
jgi:hypothetical protein